MESGITINGCASKIIEITAGKSKTKLYVHAAYLCKSDKMKALIEGEWKDREAIVLPDWDDDTIKMLLEWLYLENYSFPCPEMLPEVDMDTAPKGSLKASFVDHGSYTGDEYPPSLPVASSHDPSAEITAFLKESKTIRSLDDLLQIHQHSLAPRVSQTDCFSHWKQAVLRDWGFQKFKASYGPTLMAHAKLYALADYMILPTLKQLALEQLQDCLLFLGELPSECAIVKDLSSLVRYVYDNTHATASSEEPLRFFLASYISLNLAIWRGAEVDRLMEEGGDFAIDVTRKLSQRLELEASEAKSLRKRLFIETHAPAKKVIRVSRDQ